MRREVGGTAGLLALLALLVHTQIPNSENAQAPGRTGGAEPSSKRAMESAERDEMVDGPWLATQAYFHTAASSRRVTASDKPLLDALTSAEKKIAPEVRRAQMAPSGTRLTQILGLPDSKLEMFSVVATVADPSHTHMALVLDEQTEAIERSVQDAGWTFTQQWLPWMDRFDGGESDIRERRAQRWVQRTQEEMPGILVFRATPSNPKEKIPPGPPGFPEKVLFVFLVPETVTGGVNGPAFYAAMRMAGVLSTGKHEVGLLAPTFSGSFASLATLYKTMEKAKTLPPISQTVYGGNVTNLEFARDFAHDTNKMFHGGILDSRDYQSQFCEVLKTYRMNGREAAVLKEDEGGLQQQINVEQINVVPSDCKFRTYVFPREISHLRNAYQESASSGSKDPYGDQPSRVNFSIRDPNSGEDSIPTFSETQTPLTQDTILSSITDELNRQHTHVVFISVTNPLDGLFLLQAVRAASPDTRVFIVGPSALFVAAASRQPLDGTIFLSPYPMFFEGNDWLDCERQAGGVSGPCDLDTRPRLMFPESGAQGTYNVTQLLLSDMQASTLRAPRLYGYHQPGQSHPGLWVLTLNRFGFLPVDLMRDEKAETQSAILENGPKDASWFKNTGATGAALPNLEPRLAPRPWMITVFVVSIAIVVACFILVRSNLSRTRAKPIWLVLNDQHGRRFEALLSACLSLTALEWILALPWCTPWPEFFALQAWEENFRMNALRVSILVGLAAPPLTFIFLVFLWRTRFEFPRGSRNLFAIVYLVPSMAMFGAAIGVWDRQCTAFGDASLFFRFRALELYSGSSPALPFALACLAFFASSIFRLKQYALAGMARPRLEIRLTDSTTAFRPKLKAAYESIEERIAAPWSLEIRSCLYRIALPLAFLGTCSLVIGNSLTAFEHYPYNALLNTAIAVLVLSLAIEWCDLLSLWKRISKFLNLIQILPLPIGPAIERVAANWPRRPIWASQSVPKEAVEREMIYRLRERQILLEMIEKQSLKARYATAGMPVSDGTETVLGVAEQVEAPITHMTSAEAEGDLRRLSPLILGRLRGGPQISEFVERSPALSVSSVLRGKYVPAAYTLEDVRECQQLSAEIAARIYNDELIPAWRKSLFEDLGGKDDKGEKGPDSLEKKYLKSCADFVALNFARFIAYTVGQVQRIAWSVSLSFLLLLLLLNSYNPESSQLIARFALIVFLLMGIGVWWVFSQMERDATLSAIAHTTAGELSLDFWIQLLALGSLPFLGVLGHLFPSISQFLFHWIAPSIETAR